MTQNDLPALHQQFSRKRKNSTLLGITSIAVLLLTFTILLLGKHL